MYFSEVFTIFFNKLSRQLLYGEITLVPSLWGGLSSSFCLCALQDEARCTCALISDKVSWWRHNTDWDEVFLTVFSSVSSGKECFIVKKAVL